MSTWVVFSTGVIVKFQPVLKTTCITNNLRKKPLIQYQHLVRRQCRGGLLSRSDMRLSDKWHSVERFCQEFAGWCHQIDIEQGQRKPI